MHWNALVQALHSWHCDSKVVGMAVECWLESSAGFSKSHCSLKLKL